MFDYTRARAQMVDCQLRTNDVTSHSVLSAFLDVPREKFVPKALSTLAYRDDEIEMTSIGASRRYMTEPRTLGRMIQALEVDETTDALVIGCGTGYASAVLSRICGSVIAVESDADMAAQATEILDNLDIADVVVVEGPLQAGLPDQAPFDAILIDGAVDEVPESLLAQLSPEGRLAAIVGRSPYGRAMLYTAGEGPRSGRRIFDANARLLPGFEKVPEFEF